MLTIRYTKEFKRQYKLALKRGYNSNDLREVVELLANEQALPEKNRDHALRDTKKYRGVRECHIKPDWLLVYRVNSKKLELWLLATGSHSDLF